MIRLVFEQAEPKLFGRIVAALAKGQSSLVKLDVVKLDIEGETYCVEKETVYSGGFYFLLRRTSCRRRR